MSDLWVDTDMGFDDLWALILLRHLGCDVAGVSLVAGNSIMEEVASNAAAARAAYGFTWPVWQGVARPLYRTLETATGILGPTGMRTRGRQLELKVRDLPPKRAIAEMTAWLSDGNGAKDILALGPLTNIAKVLGGSPELARRIRRIVWMGASAGAGNHTPHAEFNAYVDADALARVAGSGIRLDIVDLTFCRQVTFGPGDLPDTDPLTLDLLGGYLDIALKRGRAGMAIYDPLAAVAIADPERIAFQPCRVEVDTSAAETYGATRIEPADTSPIRYAVGRGVGLAGACLQALEGAQAHD